MRYKVLLQFCIVLLVITVVVWQAEARSGGRGRGGGIFGGWRLNKKTGRNVNNSRRYINSGSPVQSAVPKPDAHAAGAGKHGHHHKKHHHGHKDGSKHHDSQLKNRNQQMPLGGSAGYGGYHQLPPDSKYYANVAAMPPGAVYYADLPRSSDNSDFLFGMMAAHMQLRALYNNPLYAMHVHRQQQRSQEAAADGNRIIIIENGQAVNETNATTTDASQASMSPYNTSDTPHDKQQQPQHTSSTEAQPTASAQPTNSGGIICMPMIINETDPNDAMLLVEVKKIVCFPAPPPPPVSDTTNADCNPYELKDCDDSAPEAMIIAGDIIESNSTPHETSREQSTAATATSLEEVITATTTTISQETA